MAEMSCSVCLYHTEENGNHVCRRFPPTLQKMRVKLPEDYPSGNVGGVVENIFGMFALTGPNDWCGEFEEAPTEDVVRQ